ncbi:hypothetical protein QFZ27_001626 [Inquilinus ginsengisoli]|uniref:hypothetical protein n=1 Tax=Inquilinus ginsengisoli TaxID=363840 RepID=UPI003D1F9005
MMHSQYTPEKMVWSEADFDSMGWHDCRLHLINFPNADWQMSLDLDYIFKWTPHGFWVSPATLKFFDVARLRIDMNFGDYSATFINDIKIRNKKLAPSGKMFLLDFLITCDCGIVEFESSGFTQEIRKLPIFSQTQDLGDSQRS